MQLVFYYRDGCHLCEEMAAVLYQYWPRQFADMQWRNIDADPGLRQQYNDKVPVLQLDGKVLCQHFPDLDKLGACFGAAAKPVS